MESPKAAHLAIDIGSTVVKLAHLDSSGRLISQEYFARDFDCGIGRQVDQLLLQHANPVERANVVVCSSANGGLRVGIVCLTNLFSGATLRNQVLLAGANPLFVHDLDSAVGEHRQVDILLVGGGVDGRCGESMAKRLERFDATTYNHGALVFAGNRALAERFKARFPHATIIGNPLAMGVSGSAASVFEAVRRAYLDDLVYKAGISELQGALANGIRPTPEVASRGFLRAVLNKSDLHIVGSCVVLDIGGATTDLHYTVEIVRDDSASKPERAQSIARYVFADLGVSASRDTLLLQLRGHPRLYEFLAAVMTEDVRGVYGMLREGDYVPTPELLALACLFLALDRFAEGRGPGLPTAEMARISQVILTGGAAQAVDEARARRVIALLKPVGSDNLLLQVDRRYRLWVDGITWGEDSPGGWGGASV